MKKTLSILIVLAALVTTTLIAMGNLFSPMQVEKKLSDKFTKWKKNVSLEFIQAAANGSIEPISNKPGYYKITLQGLNNYVIYFSERPKHITGIASLKNFYETWNAGKNNFNKVNPNAVLESELLQSDDHIFYTFELSNPAYDAANNTVTYNAKLLNKQQTNISRKTNIGYTTLFIDDYSTPWHGGIP